MSYKCYKTIVTHVMLRSNFFCNLLSIHATLFDEKRDAQKLSKYQTCGNYPFCESLQFLPLNQTVQKRFHNKYPFCESLQYSNYLEDISEFFFLLASLANKC
jgi:hypothetical protein